MEPDFESAPPELRPVLASVMTDPTISAWLKEILLSALERDPVDALNDAHLLLTLLNLRLRAVHASIPLP
jgi:hypothetical protein